MDKINDINDLDADLDSKKTEVLRERTNVMLSAYLKERVRMYYPNRSLGSVLEEGALMKLRSDGHIKPKEEPVEPKNFKLDRTGMLAAEARERAKRKKE